jgi:hypothetical protein
LHHKTGNCLVESSVHLLDSNEKMTEVRNTELLAAKSSITVCSKVVVALLPVLELKLVLAPELDASCSTVLNLTFN